MPQLGDPSPCDSLTVLTVSHHTASATEKVETVQGSGHVIAGLRPGVNKTRPLTTASNQSSSQ